MLRCEVHPLVAATAIANASNMWSHHDRPARATVNHRRGTGATIVEVSRLIDPAMLVEIEADAIVD